MWPAGLGALGSHCQREAVGGALTRTHARKLAGLLRTALTGLAFLEGGEEGERRNPNNFLSLSLSVSRSLAFFLFLFFFFFAKVILARDFAFFLSQSSGFTHRGSVRAPVCVCVCVCVVCNSARVCVCHDYKTLFQVALGMTNTPPNQPHPT